MTSNEKEDVDANQCQTQVDENLTMNACTKLPVVNVKYTQVSIIGYDDMGSLNYFAERQEIRNTIRQRKEIIKPTYVMIERAKAASAEIGAFGFKSYELIIGMN